MHDVGKAIGVIRMHMREENRIELTGRHTDLRQPHVGTASCVELQFYGTATIAVVAVAHQRSSASEPIEDFRAALRAGQCRN